MQRFLFPTLAFIAIVIAGCGGGSVVAPVLNPSPGPSAVIPVGPSPSSVVLTGGGYTLTFTVPPVVSGSASTITAVLQTAPPNGVTVPQSQKTSQSRSTKSIDVSLTTLVYLSVLPSATVSFASIPSFMYTLPAGVTIASGSTAYVAFYDPAKSSTGWVPVLGPGVVSGQNVTFAPLVSGVTLQGGSTYVYALIVTTQPVPTASPNPTPTAGPSGSPSASPSGSPSASPSGSCASPSASPASVPGMFAATIINCDSAITPSSSITLYIYGQNVSTNAFEGVNANGTTYALSSGSTVQPILWSGGSGNSETVYLPPLLGARVYIVDGQQLNSIFTVTGATGTGPNAPAPWNNDGSQSVYFDDIEYAESTPGSVNFDLSQTDVLGLDLEVSATGSSGTQTIGLKSGAITALAASLNGLGSPWSTLVGTDHILNPQHFSPLPTFLDTAIMATNAWDAYQGGNWMEITANSLSGTTYPGPLFGTVDANGNFDFYNGQSTADTLIGTIESPTTYAANNATTVTEQMFAQNGTFNNFMLPTPVPSPGSTPIPTTLGPAVGNRLSGALNSGVMEPSVSPSPGAPLTVQPICGTARFPGTTIAPYENQYAGALHAVANTYAYVPGAAYGYPYDDLCGTSTDTTSDGTTQMTITINPS